MRLEALDVTVVRGARTILSQVSLAVAPGELVVLAGPNGAGKSTLFDVLAGVRPPSAGRVLVHGRDLAAWTPQALARSRAVLAQRATLPFPLSVLEVVLLGRMPHGPQWGEDARRRHALDLVVAEHALARLDLLHLAERAFTMLSGGEQQRVQIARVLAQVAPTGEEGSEARLVLLDEPCASLDLAHALHLYRVLRDEARSGAAVLVVDHDLGRAASADRLVVLAQGRVLADGPPARVLEPSLVARAWGLACELVRLPSGALALDVGAPSSRQLPHRLTPTHVG